ncbi:hypothetical protein [Caballeronia insecticola]|uniref:hypothetical protein n=1 Tax=Caballeronia insecticola TaxID=758793 RepID=UPI0011837D97|nr:hypothetical protein [Caballeronia insecticola]
MRRDCFSQELKAGVVLAFASRTAFRRENIFFSALNYRCAESHRTESGQFCRSAARALRKDRAKSLFMGLARAFSGLFKGHFCALRQCRVADRRYAMAAA